MSKKQKQTKKILSTGALDHWKQGSWEYRHLGKQSLGIIEIWEHGVLVIKGPGQKSTG